MLCDIEIKFHFPAEIINDNISKLDNFLRCVLNLLIVFKIDFSFL